MFYSDLNVSGTSDSNGKRFMIIAYKGVDAVVPHAMAYNRPDDTVRELAKRGLVLPHPSAAKVLLERIQQVNEFPQTNVIVRPGFENGQFALANGQVFGSSASRPRIAYLQDPSLFRQTGTLNSWRQQIADPIAGQHIPMVAILLAIAAPLAAVTGRTICRSLEFVGPSSSGIGILPYLLGSVSGTPAKQIVQFSQFVGGQEILSSYYNDLALPVVGSDVCLTEETAKQRASALKQYLFPSYLGVRNAMQGECLVSFSGEPLLSLADATTELASLAADHHISIRVSSDREYGIFDGLPKRCPDTAAFARGLRRRADENHGVVLKEFLSRILQLDDADPASLAELVSQRLQVFRKAAAGSQVRQPNAAVIDTFGMIYAAGWVAKRQGILPSTWNVGKAVMRCYRHDQHQIAPPRRFQDILQEIATGPGVVQLGGSEPRSALFDEANVFVRERARGTELLIRPSALHAVLPDWENLNAMPAVKQTMVTEKGHQTVKRRLSNGLPQRMYCFRLHKTQ